MRVNRQKAKWSWREGTKVRGKKEDQGFNKNGRKKRVFGISGDTKEINQEG